jgi:NAD(P)-dependent dehydrogenase (short-subunit alcohol dehydrogenase family)
MKTIIITGSNGLIGKTITKHLKNKFNIVEVDFLNGHDLTDENFVKEFFNKNKGDVLINCFAKNHHIDKNEKNTNKILDISLDSFKDYLDVNLTSLFSVCREFIRNNDNGIIINFGSLYSLVSPNKKIYGGDEKHIGYSVSKAGVVMLTKHLSTHFAPNFRCNTVILGGVENNQSEEFKKKYSENTSLERMMKVDEVNSVIDFVINNTYINGVEIIVDGGWTSY